MSTHIDNLDPFLKRCFVRTYKYFLKVLYTMKLNVDVAEYQLLIYLNCTIYKLAAVLDSGTVTDAPLEVGLGYGCIGDSDRSD